jgi:uncharacterized protein
MRRGAVGSPFIAVLLFLAPPTARAQSPAQLAAARELMEVLQIGPTMAAGSTAMIELQVQQNPLLAPYRKVMLDWAAKYLTPEAAVPEIAAVYARNFSEGELRELTAFYRTPTGQKFVSQQPELTRQGAAVGQRLAAAHQAELEEMIRARAAELGQPSPAAGE